MKKLLLAAIAAGIVSTNAFAGYWATGKITEVLLYPSGVVFVALTKADTGAVLKTKINVDATIKKEFVACLLTAKSSDSTTILHHDGIGWDAISIK